MNELQYENSPFLKRHRNNMVHWYFWCEEALMKAKNENKLLFISIGFYSCHWCSVMEQECFMDKDIADILNDHYIPIIVDREINLEVDNLYMTACICMHNQGGWPLTIIATPDGIPMWIGGVLKKEDADSSAGLLGLLSRADTLWKHNPSKVRMDQKRIMHHLKEGIYHINSKEQETISHIVKKAMMNLQNNYDIYFGGFGRGKKFLMPFHLIFLEHVCEEPCKRVADKMLEHTLKAMVQGEIYDNQIGAFCRYANNRDWSAPHFEKMISDNLLLLYVYFQFGRKSKKRFYYDIAEQIAAFLLAARDESKNVFYSSVEADKEKQRIEMCKDGKCVIQSDAFDKKILLGINSLAITVFCACSEMNTDFIKYAKNIYDFINNNMKHKNGDLRSCWYEQKSFGKPVLEEYSLYISSLLALYKGTADYTFLEEAKSYTEFVLQHFKDREKGGFFFSGDWETLLFCRVKKTDDEDLPGGNATMLYNLSLLSQYDPADYKKEYEEQLHFMLPYIQCFPSAHMTSLCGLQNK